MTEKPAIWDLHCDTLTEGCQKGWGLRNNPAHFDLARLPHGWDWCQTVAIFIPDYLRGMAAIEYFEKNYLFFLRQLEENRVFAAQARDEREVEILLTEGRTALMLAVEGGAVLGGRLEQIFRLQECGVRLLTLTWNGSNELGGGAASEDGLTDFGRAGLRELERADIIVDVSHLNDRTFEEVLSLAHRPVLASHSNSRTICPHRRNLTDSQFRSIVEMGGLVGINFYLDFIVPQGVDQEAAGKKVLPEALIRHIWHFLELGGEDAIALGSDFDGCVIPDFIGEAAGLATLYTSMLQSGLGKSLTRKICFENARKFFQRYKAI